MRMQAIFAHDRTLKQPVVWVTTLVMFAFHIGAVAALFFFSWQAFVLTLVLWWMAGGFGIGVGYHRLLTHRGYKTSKWMEYLLTVCATLALEGGPIFWVATHRQHHQNTDKEGDPHSPREGGFWSHVGWLLTGQTMHNDSANLLPYVPDLRKDRFHIWISRWHWVPMTVLGVVILLAGGWKFLLGYLLPYRPWTSLHMVGELRYSYVGIAAVSYSRYLEKQLLGGPADLW